MAYDCSVEEERLQKKLVPLNIVVCIICLVAAISLIFAPVIKINLSDVKEMYLEYAAENTESTEDGSEINVEAILDKLEGEVSINAFEIGKFAFSQENSVKLLLNEAKPVLSAVIEEMLVPVVSETLVQQMEIDTEGVDLSALNDKFKALGDAKSEAEFRQAADDWLEELAKIGDTTITPEEKATALDEFAGYYNKTIDATGGEYDLEKFICVLASEGLELEEPITSYTDFIIMTLEQESGDQGEGEDGTENTTSLIEDLDYVIKLVAKGFFGFMAFTSALWLILFLFSLFHLFAQNKRFTMWYVKLFGFWPCLIFGGLQVVSAGVISTLAWISGACYIILWLISIFWAFPIKRKIRAERRS